MKHYNKIDKVFEKPHAYILILIFILAFGFLCRINTFWLAHWAGDQESYISLAMKLDHFGLKGYNLRGVDLHKGPYYLYNGKIPLAIGEALPAQEGDKGLFLELRDMVGIIQYDIPLLYYLSPGFPYMLMLSHRLFRENKGYTAPLINMDYLIRDVKPSQYFNSQFYAVIVPLFFSLLLIIVTFFLGKVLYSSIVGLYASFMVASNAVDILSSQRLWPNDMASALTALSILIFIIALNKSSKMFSILAGFIFGLAILTRQDVILVIFAIWFYSKKFFRKEALIFLGIAILTSLSWFIKTYQVYGTPVYDTAFSLDKLIATNKTDFYKLMLSRPIIPVLFGIGIPYLCPAFALSYFSIIGAFTGDKQSRTRLILRQRSVSTLSRVERLIFLWAWILAFVLYLSIFRPISREHRYMLLTYPAIAILSAYVLARIKSFFYMRFGERHIKIIEFSIVLFLILSALWSVNIGIEAAITNKSFILRPF